MSTAVIERGTDQNKQRAWELTREAPDYVKSAAHQDLYGDDQLPDRLYADPVRKQYPIHTPAATWLSLTTFHHRKEAGIQSLAVEESLRKAARYHGIVSDLIERPADTVNYRDLEIPPEQCALTEKTAGGVRGRYPLRSPQEVKQAFAYLQEYHDRLPYTVRHEMAGNICKAAKAHGVTWLDGQQAELDRQLGFGAYKPGHVRDFLDGRALLLPQSAPERPLLKQAAEAIYAAKVLSHGQLVKLAGTLDRIDRAYRLNYAYKSAGGSLWRPEDVLFEIPLKEASDFASSLVKLPHSRNHYALEDVSNINPRWFSEILGDDVAEKFSQARILGRDKLAAWVGSLDSDSSALCERLLVKNGCCPRWRDRSEAKPLDDQALQALLDLPE